MAFDGFHGRGLARAVGTEQREQLALRDLEADVPHGLEIAVRAMEFFDFEYVVPHAIQPPARGRDTAVVDVRNPSGTYPVRS
jgi:hypothetical protein